MTHILVIGGHEETFKMIADLPVRVTIFQSPEGITELQTQMAARIRIVDSTSCEDVLRHATEIHAVDPFVGVISFTEYGLLPAATVCDALRIRGNALAAVRLTRDKLAMRAALNEAGLGTVRFQRCTSEADARCFFEQLGRSMIMKPAEGSGSSGVFRIDDVADIPSAWTRTRAEHHGPTVVEELLDGKEYSVESMTTIEGRHTILAVTEKMTTGAPRFVEVGHRMPAPLPLAVTEQMKRFVTAFLDTIGHTFGPAHTEVMRTCDGLRIIEGNTRPGGDFIWELVLHAIGFDLVRESVRELAGLPWSAGQLMQRGAGAGRVSFFAHESCTILEAEGFEDARRSPGVIRLHCSLEPGNVLGPLRSSDDRQGVIVTIGQTTAEADIRLAAALEAITVKVDDRRPPLWERASRLLVSSMERTATP